MCWPAQLTYPHLYVIKGGFRAFHAQYPQLCEGVYAEMDRPESAAELREAERHARASWGSTTAGRT
jgi:hypothetical protein